MSSDNTARLDADILQLKKRGKTMFTKSPEKAKTVYVQILRTFFITVNASDFIIYGIYDKTADTVTVATLTPTDFVNEFSGISQTSDSTPLYRIKAKNGKRDAEKLISTYSGKILCKYSDLEKVMNLYHCENVGTAFELLINHALTGATTPKKDTSAFFESADVTAPDGTTYSVKLGNATIATEKHMSMLHMHPNP